MADSKTLQTILEKVLQETAGPCPDPSFRHPCPQDPEVAVAMPARNVAAFLPTALWSVLTQEGVALEVVVVDDDSSDGTAEAAEAVRDPRVRVLRNGRRRGIGFCHNRVLEATRAPVVVHVDGDDFIAPGALRKMVDALEMNPEAGQAYCNCLVVGPEGSLTEREIQAQVSFLETQRRLNPDYRRGLLEHGMVTNTLRTYRRSALLEAGAFNERLPYAVDYEMAVRIADIRDMVLVPEFLYFQRVHPANTQQSLSFRPLRSWALRSRICLGLLVRLRGRLLGRGALAVLGLLLLGLLHVLRITEAMRWLTGRRAPREPGLRPSRL